MKLIAIGDIHGRTTWKQIAKPAEADKIVFIGDYFDSKKPMAAEDQIANFNEIVALKRNAPDKVVLLCGNHDFHYLRSAGEQYFGFQHHRSAEISEVIHNALVDQSIQMAYSYGHYLFTHAGVTKTWLRIHGYNEEPVGDFVNQLFYEQPASFRFQTGENKSKNGDDVTQSPIWVRPPSLRKDGIDGFTQIIGHTNRPNILMEDRLIIIDALATGEFLTIDDAGNEATRPRIQITYPARAGRE